MWELVSKEALRPTTAQTLSTFHHALLKKNGCFFCRDTACGFPLSSSRTFFKFAVCLFFSHPFSILKILQLHEEIWSRVCSLTVSHILYYNLKNVSDANINYIKLRVFLKCAENILGMDTQQQLKVNSWGWLTEESQVWWLWFVARERYRFSKLGPVKLNLLLDLTFRSLI